MGGYTCSIPTCKHDAFSGGYCSAHYQRIRRGWDADEMDIPVRDYEKKISSICSAEGCKNPNDSRGLCVKHYQERKRNVLKNGQAAAVQSKRRSIHIQRYCTFPGCERHYFAKGFCSTHYHRNRNGRSMDAPMRKEQYQADTSVHTQ